MSWKWMGAIMIVVGCGGFGFSLAAAHRAQERTLGQLLEILQYMYSELQYRLTPLPELCRRASGAVPGTVGSVFSSLVKELDRQVYPDVSRCMAEILASRWDIPSKTAGLLAKMGTTLGQFHLEGQLSGFRQTMDCCKQELEALGKNRAERLRSYQTLGLCAGAALAIILL